MEPLRAPISGPSQATAGAAGQPGPAPALASAPFEAALFEEGARAGPPQNSLARGVAALDGERRPGMGDGLPPDLDRREFALEDNVPESDFSLGDLLDIVNPLQHIPIVANVYRNLTGDTISGPARVAGAALYGGPVGMLAGIANAIAAEVNGRDLGDSLVAGILGESPADDALLAETPPPAATPGQAADTVPLAASFAPRPQDRVLTGDAALGALLGDLRAAAAMPAESPDPAPVLPASAPRPPAGAARGFSAQMMQGLDKYRDLAIERGGPGRPAPERLDRGL